MPRVTPSARASREAARTRSRLPTRSRTTTGTSRSASSRRRAAITGQSGHQTQPVRLTWLPRSAIRGSAASARLTWLLAPHGSHRARRRGLRFHVYVELARASRPLPASSPRHAPPRACRRSVASAGHSPSATSTAARSRARAVSRRASLVRKRGGIVATTSATPSRRAPTTALHRSGGTRRTTAHRSSSTPASTAARPPHVPSGSTTAAHSPAEVAAAASVYATVVDPAPGGPSSATVLPRATPPAGRNAPTGPSITSNRSRARTAGAARAAAARSRARDSWSRSGSVLRGSVGSACAPMPST